MKKAKTGKLPRIRVDDPGLQRYLDAMAATMELREGDRGDKKDAFVSWGDLLDAQVVQRRYPSGSASSSNPANEFTAPDREFELPDFTIPPELTGVTIGAAVQSVLLSWIWPGNWMGNFSHVNIYRSEEDNFGTAVKVGEATGSSYTDPVGPGQSYYYWLTITNEDGVEGPVHSVSGEFAQTGVDVSHLLDVLQGELGESQLVEDLQSRIDLIDEPGTGLVQQVDQIASSVGGGASGENLLHDGDLAKVSNERSPGWYWYSPSSKPSTLVSRSNGTSLRIEYYSTRDAYRYNRAINPDTISATEGEAFRVRGWYYLDSQAQPRDQMGPVALALKQFGGGQDVGSLLAFGMETTTRHWHKIDAVLRVETGKGVSSVQFEPRVYMDHGAAFFDDMELYRISEGEDQGTSILERLAQVEPGRASYSVKTDVDGRITGFGFASTFEQSEFSIVADRFTLAPPGGSDKGTAPFYHLTVPSYIDGKQVPAGTYLKQAYAEALTVKALQAEEAFLDRLTAVHGTLAVANIEKANVFDLTVDNQISSDPYYPGQYGWIIHKDGSAEFNDGVQIRALNVIDTLQIAGNAVTIPSSAQASYRTSIHKTFDHGDPSYRWGWQIVLSLTEYISWPPPEAIIVSATMNWLNNGTSSGLTGVHMRIRHPGSGQVSAQSGISTKWSTSMATQGLFHSISSGNQEFVLEVAQARQGASFNAGPRSMTLLGAKR